MNTIPQIITTKPQTASYKTTNNKNKNFFSEKSLSIKESLKAKLYTTAKSNKIGSSTITKGVFDYHFELSYSAKQAIAEGKAKKGVTKNLNISIDLKIKSVKKTTEVKKSSFESPEEFYSPKKVAKRIVDFARSLFPVWLEQNKKSDSSKEDKILSFISKIKDGIQQGVKEAVSDLKNINKYDDNSKNAISSIQEEIEKLLKNFSSVLDKDYDYLTTPNQQQIDMTKVA